MLNLELLNYKFVQLFPDGLSGIHAIEFSPEIVNSPSVTVSPNNGDAFNLNKAVSGIVKHIDIPQKSENTAVWRGIIGYTKIARMQYSTSLFNYTMASMVIQALTELTYAVGDLSDRKVFAYRPGLTNEFFREIEDCAAIEFRVCVV